MTRGIRRGVLLLSLVVLGCGGTNAAPAEDGGLRPCTNDDQCLANETCSLGYCQPGAQKDAAPDAEPGTLKVTPGDVVDFGSPVYGSEIERQVTLENVGGVALTVNSIDLTENDATKEYVLDKPTTPFELQPAASQVVTVRLKPIDGQLDQGQLIINSTDATHPTVILQLVTATKGAVDLEMCVEKTSATDCEDPPAFPLGQLSYGVAATRTFHVRATGQGTPVIDAQSITLLSTGGLTSTHYQLQLYYRHPSPTDPSQSIEDATALVAGDFPKILSAGDENTAPAELRGVLTFDALATGAVPSESVSVQTDAGNIVAPVTGQVSGCPPGSWDLDGDPSNGCEYVCTYQGATDDPDDNFVDANCDGIDGEIGKAIFVAPPPKGDDTTGNGTMATPYATITKGIQAANAAAKKQVFIGAGTYAENVTLVDGISLYGGYDSSATFWQRALGNDTAIIGHALGTADEVTLRGTGLTKATTLDRLMILSQPASPGFSSYAVIVTNVATNLLTISNCEIHSGNGGLGTDGSPGTSGQAGQNGSNGGAGLEYSCANQSWQPFGCVIYCSAGGSICNNGTVPTGGAAGGSACSRTGGTGATGGESGKGGNTGSSAVGGATGGSGGANQSAGQPGADGASGANGTSGQKGLSFGGATAGGYAASSGTAGTAGTHGGGGGGGGSGGGDAPYWTDLTTFACCASAGGSGGGGGGGGCAGGAGGYGRGAGGSFGVYLYNASPTIRKCTIYSGTGGAGGRGGEGATGGLGSTGGTGGAGIIDSDPVEVTGAGGTGGAGGKAGRGGHGGGGGGGPSIGVLKAGGANPTIDSATQLRIYPGTAGAGGSSPDPAASGDAGVSAAVHTV
jgi:hypothetical protein